MDTFNPQLTDATAAMERAATAEEGAKPGSIDAVGPDIGPIEQNPLITLGFTPEFIGEMWGLVEQGTERVKKESERWKVLLNEYIPKVSKSGEPEAVSTNSHFRNTHTKIGQLFLQNPEIRVIDQPVSATQTQKMSPMGMPIMMEDIISVKQELLNKKLGRGGIRANRLMDELLFDSLQWSGIACCKVGHTIILQPVQQPVMGPDPNFVPPPPTGVLNIQGPQQPPMVPQMDPMTGQPQMETIQVPIYEEDYIRRFSPMKLVMDPNLKSSRYDEDASMLGMWFSMTPFQATATLGVSQDEIGQGEKDDKVYEHRNSSGADASDNVVMGVELFIKASSVDPSITHPDAPVKPVHHPKKLYQMVLLKNMKDKPIVWRECVDQTFTDTGELTENSLDRFPIQILAIRDLADSAFPEADAAFTNAIVKTRNTSRRQEIALRDASLPKILVDGGAFEDNDFARLENGAPGAIVKVGEGKLDRGADKIIAPMPLPRQSPDSGRLDQVLKQEMDETLGISANSAGATNDTVRAATEIAATQQGAAGRSQKEQDRVIDFYLGLVQLLDIYICRYTKQAEYIRIVGQEGLSRIMAWNGQMLSGRWIYEIAPDSQLRIDTAQDRQQNLNFYNLVAKDPLVDRAPILRRLARQFGYDPSKIIINPAAMMAQPPHGGEVNKHAMEQTGGQRSAPGAENQSESARQPAEPAQE